MPWHQHFTADKLVLFTLVLTRVSGLTMTAPIYGTKDVPAQARVLLAVILAALITPSQWHASPEVPATSFGYLVLVGGELLIGVCLGLGVLFLLTGMQLAGELIGNVSGLQAAEVFDPTFDANASFFSRLLAMIATVVFVLIGGHRMVMAGLLDTFAAIRPGGAGLPATLAEAFTTLLTQSFQLGIRAGAPAVVALLLATVILGLIGRTLPQLNLMVVGFGLNSMLVLAAVGLTLGAAVWAFQHEVEPMLQTVREALTVNGVGSQ